MEEISNLIATKLDVTTIATPENALSLDGSGDYVDLPIASLPAGNAARTIEGMDKNFFKHYAKYS